MRVGIMLVIFSGLPGTGKTSAAEELSRQLRAERLTTDELRRRIDKHPDYSQKHKRSIYAALMKEAEKCIQKGKKVILDGTFFKQEMRQRARELAQKHDESFYVVFVTCPQGIVKKRLEKREKAGADASEADFRVYKIIQKQFEEIEDPDYIIDTSDEAEWKEKIPDLANRIRIKSRHTGMIDPLMKEGRRLFQTHMSWIILDGTYAWKIKKPVKYQFVDYSTLAQRKKFCFREKRLNSLISPSMYMGVESIVKTNGKVEFGQGGSILDYCVKMKELSQEDRMDHRLEKNQVSRLS
ncbi:AAA family ATPase, partial [bacterium]|nr:AAA family ATPase [bacterium]